jgi:hypothetical protein
MVWEGIERSENVLHGVTIEVSYEQCRNQCERKRSSNSTVNHYVFTPTLTIFSPYAWAK